MRAAVWLSVLPFLVCASQGRAAPTVNYYETRVLSLPKTLPKHDLRAGIVAAADEKKLKRIEVRTASGDVTRVYPTNGALQPVPPYILAVISMALGTDLVGAEVDLLLPVTDETFRPITLHWEAGPRVIRVTMGKAMNAFPLHSDARVIPKFRHTHRTEFVGKGWTDEGQRLVNAAYDRLSKEERIFIQDVPFARQNRPSAKMRGRVQTKDKRYRTMNAVYTENESGARVIVFDSTFDESQQFAGPVHSPQPASLLTLVHELAHGLARYPARQQMSAHRRLHQRFEAKRAAFNEDVNARNQYVKSRKRTQTAGVTEKIRAWDNRLTEQQRTLNQLKKELKRSQVAIEQSAGRESRVARALRRVLKDTAKAPTLYGRLSMEEAFAECFALFHIDPDALRRTAPHVHAWFTRGGHVDAVRADLKARRSE